MALWFMKRNEIDPSFNRSFVWLSCTHFTTFDEVFGIQFWPISLWCFARNGFIWHKADLRLERVVANYAASLNLIQRFESQPNIALSQKMWNAPQTSPSHDSQITSTILLHRGGSPNLGSPIRVFVLCHFINLDCDKHRYFNITSLYCALALPQYNTHIFPCHLITTAEKVLSSFNHVLLTLYCIAVKDSLSQAGCLAGLVFKEEENAMRDAL